MNTAEALRLFAYTEWANARTIDVIRTLSEEQYTRALESSFPSIRDTLGHIVLVEWVWLRRWKGESPTAPPDVDYALDALVAKLREVEEERRAFVATLTDDALAQPLSYRAIDGAAFTQILGDLVTHLVNHSTYHRGQLATLLRQVGAAPPSTDFVKFVRETSH
ncbi:MAG: DinB family protein [Acidobacteria bacterium]|nr:DinB family protein [Acidobacteriota bacterium]MBV9479119.1 DinB family protein [Acidobacteriota bacterium]